MNHPRLLFASTLLITFSAGSLNAENEPQILQLDADKDRTITREEAGERWRYIERLDSNSDGKVAPDEWKAAGARAQAKRSPKAIFDRFDANKDGAISKDEVPERLWERIAKADTDGNGAISKEEIAKAGAGRNAQEKKNARGQTQESDASPKEGGKFDGSRLVEFIKRSDSNNDGKLQQNEVSDEVWSRVNRLDRDGDGSISTSEVENAVKMSGATRSSEPGKRSPADFIAFYDKDEDGALSKSEISETMWARMSKADENADGKVSASELEHLFADRY